MNIYCTYFDHRYIDRGIAMIRSLRRVDPDCQVVVLCLTDYCADILTKLREPGVVLITLERFESENEDIVAIKSTRTMIEYYFTLTGALVYYLLIQSKSGSLITYIDADLLFYSSPAGIYEELKGGSVGLTSHRFRWGMSRLKRYGKYNVGWTTFRADDTGISAAKFWRDSCVKWCYDYVEGDKFADQKYLEHIQKNYNGVIEINTAGVNVAPWNLGRYSMFKRDDGAIFVDAVNPLVFFHFHGLKREGNTYLVNHLTYLEGFPAFVRDNLYVPYIRTLRLISNEIGALSASGPESEPRLARGSELDNAAHKRLTLWRKRLVRKASLLLGHCVIDNGIN